MSWVASLGSYDTQSFSCHNLLNSDCPVLCAQVLSFIHHVQPTAF